VAALGADAGIGRNEGGVERALGENGAEVIGQPERHEESVGDRPSAENRRQHDVAQKAGQAREQRGAADSEKATDHCCPISNGRWPKLWSDITRVGVSW